MPLIKRIQLRKLVNHPYSIEDAAPDPYYLGEHLVLASSKFQLLDKLLKKILDDGEKVLIFSGFTGTLDLIEDLLRLREIKYGRLDGQTGRARRSLDIKLFNRDPSPFKVFLISTRAGGLGLNLATASNVVMFDCDWNPQATKQAIARAHRIGQAKTVKVYTLVAEESVESQMLSRIQKK
jgi:SWI/SNF-related matrix-associated actin-dependent regulator of chromatin subfamily A member 5